MTLRWALASLHLLALGIGLGAVWVRSRSLRCELDARELRRVFRADAWWGAAAALWIGTGVWRLLGGLEKSTEYYLNNHVFLGKMGLLLVILALEIRPMITLMRWRRSVAAGRILDLRAAPALATISMVQAGLVVLMVLAATAMARGIGAGGAQ
jgi:putative membrane protein